MRRMRIFGATLALLAGIGLTAAGPAFAVRAGEFCSNANAGVVTTAENGDTVNLSPACPLRHRTNAEMHSDPSADENANLFAEKQSCGGPEWNRRDHGTETKSRQ